MNSLNRYAALFLTILGFTAAPAKAGTLTTSLLDEETDIVNTGGNLVSAANFGERAVVVNGLTHGAGRAAGAKLTGRLQFEGDHRNNQSRSPLDSTLDKLLSGIAGGRRVKLEIGGLQVGQNYLFQTYWEGKTGESLAITMEGVDTVNNVADLTPAMLISYSFTATDDTLNIDIDRDDNRGGDPNNWLSGYSLQEVLPGQVPPVARPSIAKLAAPKRAAVFKLSTTKVHSFGVFISAEGLALVHLQALATKERPRVTLADGSSLKLGAILGIFPEQELALLKLAHAPKDWLKLATAEPAVDETIALIPLNTDNPWDGRIPPVVGPVMAKRSTMTANLRDVRFVKILSLGSGLSAMQRSALGPGRFGVDRKGELVAFSAGTSQLGRQTLISLAPVVHLRDQINALTKGGKEIGFPLPKDKNPVDMASLDPDFHTMNMAKTQGNWAKFQGLIEGLHKRYPQSPLITSNLAMLADPQLRNQLPRKFDADAFRKTLKVDPGESAAHQVSHLSTRADLLMMQGRFADAMKVAKEAIALSPDDYIGNRVNVATILAQNGKFAEAEKLARALYVHNSDSWDVVQLLGFTVVRQGKADKAPDTRKRLRELVKIYGIQ